MGMVSMRMMLLAGAVVAAWASPAPAAPLSYDCDSGAGRFSELKQTQPGPDYHISGRISANELGIHERWAPVGNIEIESADQKNRAMLQILAPARKAPLDVVLRTWNGEKVATQTLGQVGLNEDVTFSMAVGDGRVKVEFGTMRGEARVEMAAGANVGVGCSTGNYHFEDLRLEDSER
jgi:hypothetical protein